MTSQPFIWTWQETLNELYENLKGGVGSNEFNEFINKNIKNKYKNHYVLLDNASFHRSKIVKENITNSKNKYPYSLPYNPQSNPIENLFSQIKNYVRQETAHTYTKLNEVITNTIKNNVKTEHTKNYFKSLFMQTNNFINKNKMIPPK